MKSYSSPALTDYGPIGDCTFATPNQGGDPHTPGGGPFECGPTAGQEGPGSKAAVVLQCDKFGEYSHS